jgi:hydroxymethylpyrimidine/phosphomethylpyrimidine kinase
MQREAQLLPTLLIIAGSDPSGGAGIQADLKTISSIGGVYAAAAISCLTVQNSRGVSEIHPLTPLLVQQQVQAVFSDHLVTHIKIGMVGTLSIALTLAELLADFQGEIVYDPVLAATSGHSLMDITNLTGLKNSLLSQVTVLTPNLQELEYLSGQRITNPQGAIACAKNLLADFPRLKALVVKGGHQPTPSPDLVDYFIEKNGSVTESRRPRINNPHLHGTGCTYASAFTAFHCKGQSLQASFLAAGDYMDTLIRKGLGQTVIRNKTNGPLLHTV